METFLWVSNILQNALSAKKRFFHFGPVNISSSKGTQAPAKAMNCPQAVPTQWVTNLQTKNPSAKMPSSESYIAKLLHTVQNDSPGPWDAAEKINLTWVGAPSDHRNLPIKNVFETGQSS